MDHGDIDAHRDLLHERVKNDLGYHRPPDEAAAALCQQLRALAVHYASSVISRCPPGRDLSMALSHIEEASRAAIASVAKTWPLEGP